MLSERKLNQTCAGFSDNCVKGTTCDPDTNICVTEDSKCCLYAIPEVLSTPFLRLCLTVSLTFFIVLFVFVYMSLSVLTLCPAVATPPLSRCPSLSRTRSGVPRMQKSGSSAFLFVSCVCNSCMLFPDTMIFVTDDSMCCLYAIPGVLSTPFLCLCPTLSLSLLHRSICICVRVLICSGILSSCCIASSIKMSISFPHAQCYAADAEVRVLCAENQALRKIHSVKSDSATMEVGMFRLMPRVLPSYSFIAAFSIYSASLCYSRSQLNVK